jgi:two-component system, cell cycle sensor histidine kinase and response regulator CckA
MRSPLRLLLLEDNPVDAELILTTLERAGIRHDAVRVDHREDFVSALEEHGFDLILADFCLPSFDGLSALEIVRSRHKDLPFIFVSGAIGEEVAIESLRKGATDYVLKQRLSRLAPAVGRALEEAEQQTARREAESLFRALFDQVTVGVAITGLDGRITRANPALQVLFGYGENELNGIQLADLTHPDDVDSGRELDEQLHSGSRASYEVEKRFVRRDGKAIEGRVLVSLIQHNGNQDGKVRQSSINLIEDITSRKELERGFLRAQKMEVVGRIAASFAHDFNNLLTVINGYADDLVDRFPEQDATSRKLREIRGSGERAAKLTQRLLSFSRKAPSCLQVLDLNSLLTELEPLLQRIVGAQTRLMIQRSGSKATIEADHSQIEQAVMNLAINARDAMPDGGNLTITVGQVQVDDAAGAKLKVPLGQYVALTVQDTGSGMDENTQSKVFEAFFTTKEVGKGTGLGLWSVSETVRQSRGAIGMESKLGLGTTFRIYLPTAVEAGDDIRTLGNSLATPSALRTRESDLLEMT